MARYWEKLAKLKSKPTEDDKFSSNLLKFQTIEGSPFTPSAYDSATGSILHGGEIVSNQGEVLPARLSPITTDEERLQASLMENMGAPSYYTGGFLGQRQDLATAPQQNIQDTRLSVQPQQQVQPTTAQTNVNDSMSILRPPTTQQPTQAVQPQQAQKVAPQYRADVDTGMGLLRGVATGEDSVYDQQRDVSAGQLGAQQAATQAAQQQAIAQQGASPEMAGVLGADLSRRQEIAQGDLQTEFGLAEAAGQLAAGRELMTTSLGLDQLDYNRTQGEIDQLLTLGGAENIQKAEELGAQLYGFGIDYSKAGLADVEANMNNIMTWVEQFGTDAPPEVLQIMGQKYGELMTQQNAIRGLEFTPEQVAQMSNAIVGNNPQEAGPAIQLGSGVMDWWDNGDGSPLKMMLTGQAAQARDILSDPNASPEAKQRAAIEMGEIIGTAFYAMNGHSDKLTDQQKALLDNSGLGMLSGTEAQKGVMSEEVQESVEDILAGLNKNNWTSVINDPAAWGTVVSNLNMTSSNVLMQPSTSREKDNNRRWTARLPGLHDKSGENVVINGIPYKVSGQQRSKRRGSRDTWVYSLVNLKDGSNYTVEASSGIENLPTSEVIGSELPPNQGSWDTIMDQTGGELPGTLRTRTGGI